ncbi:MAG: hypothetical protein Q4C56_08485 [Peptococcaceae bacterium]|nr:hypothetical protein [Peptococcaceae bacterium]
MVRDGSPHPYADILDAVRPVSRRHQPMDRAHRAAQFGAFAALSGYDEIVREMSRLIDEEGCSPEAAASQVLAGFDMAALLAPENEDAQ